MRDPNDSDPRPMDLVTLGEVLIDMFPAETGRRLVEVTAFHPAPGGAPANVAVAAARLGARSAFVGKVGDDLFGEHLADVLAAEGVDTRGVCVAAEARTTMAIIAKPDENSAEYVFYRNPGADVLLRPDELDEALLGSTRAFEFGSLSLTDDPIRSTTHRAAALARAGGALVAYDANYRPSLWHDPAEALTQMQAMLPLVDLLKVNEEELALLAGSDPAQGAGLEALEAQARALLTAGPSVVVITLGAAGSAFCTADAFETAAPFAVEAVDAVGCGDAFVAGLLTQIAAHDDWRAALDAPTLRAALRYANAVGALTARKRGAIPALPTAGEVAAFLAAQG